MVKIGSQYDRNIEFEIEHWRYTFHNPRKKNSLVCWRHWWKKQYNVHNNMQRNKVPSSLISRDRKIGIFPPVQTIPLIMVLNLQLKLLRIDQKHLTSIKFASKNQFMYLAFNHRQDHRSKSVNPSIILKCESRISIRSIKNACEKELVLPLLYRWSF